jgi:hypothetical protein
MPGGPIQWLQTSQVFAFTDEVIYRLQAISSDLLTSILAWQLQYVNSIVGYSALLRRLSRCLQQGTAGKKRLCTGVFQLVLELGSAVCGICWRGNPTKTMCSPC